MLAPAAVRAQVIADDFANSANWTGNTALLGTPTFTFSNGVANYVVASPTSNDFAYVGYTGAVGSYSSDWSVQVDLRFATPSSVFTSSTEQAIDLFLSVTRTGATLGVADGGPTFHAYGAAMVLTQSTIYESWFRNTLFNPTAADQNMRVVDGARLNQISNVSSASEGTVRISFDSATKTLSSAYDANGAAGGYTFTAMDLTMDVDADATNWDMVNGDTFTFMLWGNSLFDAETGEGVGPTLGVGATTFDNFAGTNISAVPEPSAFALLAGCGALVLASGRRRRGAAR